MIFERKIVGFICRRFLSNKQITAEKTALYNFHVKNGGKIVNFGGFLLPVQYNDLSIASSHVHTRKNASIFDVSHMLQTEIVGKDCLDYMESICTADLKSLAKNSSVLTVFTNKNGGILDDLIITKVDDDHLYVVSNAAVKKQDQGIMMDALKVFQAKKTDSKIIIKFYEPMERGLLALQGPKSASALQNLTEIDLSKLYFMTSTVGNIDGVENCRITRCGYTGEDGFEISMPAEKQVRVTESLLAQESVKLAGLGARDSLRLEAGLCLYGSDIDGSTTPIEAGLTWLVAKARREAKGFPGAEIIVNQIKDGSRRKRVGIILDAGPPARHGTKILSVENEEIGLITSGCPAPSLGKNIAMGYVPSNYNKVGTELSLSIRDKIYAGIVTKMPFIPSQYYVKPKSS